ncbi:MAG: molybdenum cofactor guanylyltransferase [Candidatus Omnitrophota bacterium]
MLKMHNEKHDISCAIFAGGKNSRMGTRKAFLKFKGKTFIETIRDYASAYFESIFIVSDKEEGFFIDKTPVVKDIIPGRGPLGALYTALNASDRDRLFVIACDMPFANDLLIQRIIRKSADSAFDCFIPRSANGPEPLFGIYRKRLEFAVKEEILAGRLNVSKFLEKRGTYYINIDDDDKGLININTPKEYESYAGEI